MFVSALKQLTNRLSTFQHQAKCPEQIYLQRRLFRNCMYLYSSQKNRGNSKPNQDDYDDEEDDKGQIKQESRVSTYTYFDAKEKNKKTFNAMLDLYKQRIGNRRGHVEFIYAAMKHIEEYGAKYDIQTYKNIISVLPEGKYVPENAFQTEFVHFPYQQYCIVALLDQMETAGICPDQDMLDMLKRRFGKYGHPVRKCGRMIYWMRKFKNASPWPVPFPPPTDAFFLAQLAVERIVSVDPQSKVSVYQTDSLPDAIDNTYIVSGISPTQKKLISDHPRDKPIYVEGGFRIWLRTQTITYFVLRADNDWEDLGPEDTDDFEHMTSPLLRYKNIGKSKKLRKLPSVHEQEGGTIFGVCASGTSSRDSLLSWVRLLEQDGNPALGEIPILFTLKSPLGDVVPMNDEPNERPSNDQNEKISLEE